MAAKPGKNRPPQQRSLRHHEKVKLPGGAPANGVPEPKSRARDLRAVVAVCALLLAAVTLVFGQTIRHEFVNFDDDKYVVDNPQIAGGLTAHGIAWAATHSHVGNWHPLSSISHMLDCQFYGLRPGGHHLTNILLHAATAVVLLLVLRRMTGELWPSALVAALFAIHPLRVESVAWVAERKDVLSGLLFTLTLGAYLGYVRRPFSLWRYMAVAALFALGLMAKPMLVTMPLVLLLLDYWPLGRFGESLQGVDTGRSRSRFSRLVVEKIPLLILAAASCMATLLAQVEAMAPSDLVPVASRIANGLVSYVAYLGQMFTPAGLAVLYPHPGSHLPIWKIVSALLLLVAISVAAWAWRRKCPYVLVGWLWYLGTLVPVIGLIQVGPQAMADRYTYLPQIGVCLALVWTLRRLSADWPYRRQLCGVASALAIAVLMGCAWRQASFWHDSETLWTHTLACTSRNAIAHTDLGLALVHSGRIDEALDHYREAVTIRPELVATRNNFGDALLRKKRVNEAMSQFEAALNLDPLHAESHNNLGVALAQRGATDDAIAHYRKALELKPDYSEAHFNLGDAWLQKGQFEEAFACYRKALEIKPLDPAIHNNFGNGLAKAGRLDEAVAHYRQALEIVPGDGDAYNNLGNALCNQGKIDEAIVSFRNGLENRPNDVRIHNNLGNALLLKGRADEATGQFEQVLEVDPNDAEAHYNLGNVLAGKGRFDEAMARYRKAVASRPDYADAHQNLGVLLHQQGKIAEALAQWREVIRLRPNDTGLLNAVSRLLATHPDASVRNGPEAAEMARRAVQLSGERDPALMDTLAAACAEAGRFAEATEVAQHALLLATARGNAVLAEALRSRIKLYQAGSPFRDAQPSAGTGATRPQ